MDVSQCPMLRTYGTEASITTETAPTRDLQPMDQAQQQSRGEGGLLAQLGV